MPHPSFGLLTFGCRSDSVLKKSKSEFIQVKSTSYEEKGGNQTLTDPR